MKKIIALFLATFLMVGCVGLTASAAETATVSLLGASQAIVGEEYEVVLNVVESAADAVGGISGTVTYDSAKFELARVEIDPDFATANYITEETATEAINTSTAGKINLALLGVKGDAEVNDWITFIFTVKADATGTSEFKIENPALSDAAGTALISTPLTVNVTSNAYAHMIDVNGATISKDDKGNIRFETTFDKDVSLDGIAEIGVLIIPTIYVDNGDITFDKDNNAKYTSAIYGEKTIAKASIAKADLPEDWDGKLYGYLLNTTKYNVNAKFSARAYVKTTDGSVYIYSDNKDATKNIKGGTSSKDCVSIAKAIIANNQAAWDSNASADVKELAANTTWSNDDYKAIVAVLKTIAS